jgi:hypothetical protein
MLSAHRTEYFRHGGEELHVAAHSHHPWPDLARAAHLRYRQGSAKLRIRFGFGVYHDTGFPQRLIERVEQALTS